MAKEDGLIVSLACGASATKAAEDAGIGLRTVQKRLADPTFRARIDEARAQMVSAAVGALSSIGARATEKLDYLMEHGEAQKTQLGAARAILEFMFKGHDVDTLKKQVQELKTEVERITHELANAPARHAEAISGPGNGGSGLGGEPGDLAPPGAPESEPGTPDGTGGQTPGPLAEEDTQFFG